MKETACSSLLLFKALSGTIQTKDGKLITALKSWDIFLFKLRPWCHCYVSARKMIAIFVGTTSGHWDMREEQPDTLCLVSLGHYGSLLHYHPRWSARLTAVHCSGCWHAHCCSAWRQAKQQCCNRKSWEAWLFVYLASKLHAHAVLAMWEWVLETWAVREAELYLHALGFRRANLWRHLVLVTVSHAVHVRLAVLYWKDDWSILGCVQC